MQPARRRKLFFVPQVEVFEERALLSTISWLNPLGGDWDNPLNWLGAKVPGPADTALVTLPGITITHASATADSVYSLYSLAGLNLSAGSLSLAAASKTGTLDLKGGTLTGPGNLKVVSLFTWDSGTLSGSGQLNVAGATSITGGGPMTLDGRRLNLAGATTWSCGDITFANGALLTNQSGGVFDDQVDASLANSGLGALSTFINYGTFLKSGGSGTTGIGIAFRNKGSVTLKTGTLALTAGGFSSGAFVGDPGTVLQFEGSQFFTSSSTISAACVEFVNAQAKVAGAYAATGQTSLLDNSTVRFTGVVTGLGGLLDIQGGTAEFDGAVPSPVSLTDLRIGTDSTGTGGTLTGTANFVVYGLFTWEAGSVTGSGTLDALGGLKITGSCPKVLDARTLNNAATTTWDGGAVATANGATFNNLAGASFDDQTDAAFDPTFTNAGTFLKSVCTGTTNISSFTNTGTVNLACGTLNAGNYVQTSGATNLTGGSLSSPNAVQINGGQLVGPGTINADVINDGEINPGSTGILNISGNYAQQAHGVLDAELGGTTAGSQFDQLNVSGSASLDGTLNVTYAPGFAPDGGDSYTVLTFASRAGDFAAKNGLNFSSGQTLTANYNPGDLTLVDDAPSPTPNPPPPPPASGSSGQPPSGSSNAPPQQTSSPSSPPAGSSSASSAGSGTSGPPPVSSPPPPSNPPPATSPGGASSPPASSAAAGSTNSNPSSFSSNGAVASSGTGTAWSADPAAQGQRAPSTNPPADPPADSKVLSWSLGPTSQASSGSQRGPAYEIGSGDDELVDVILSRPHDLELLFEKDVLTGSDIAGALLTGGKPRADLLPQKGSHVAPVATLLSGEGDDLAVSPTATDEEKAVLMELLINPIRKSIHPLSGISIHSVGHGPRANSGDERSALIEQDPGSNVPEEGKTSDARALRQCANALLLALGCGFLVTTRGRPRRTSSASCGRPSRTRWSQQLLAWLRAQFWK